uniref:phosphotransferase family protein n=1 Tax=Gordonia sp. B7-2 TaxID=3420932 RepID=UPI003D9178DE
MNQRTDDQLEVRAVTDADEVAARIAPRLSQDGSLVAQSARVLPAGASRTTFLVGLSGGSTDAIENVIVRAVPSARTGDGGLGIEAAVLGAAHAAGVPVPRVLDSGLGAGESVLGYPYFVMNFVVGESIPRRILRDDEYATARAGFVGQAGEILARIHRMDRSGLGVLPSMPDPLAALAGLFPREWDEMPAGLVLAAGWLDRNRPEPSPEVTVVHGDFRLGNLMIDSEGIAAVLDWELAHVGDPVEDLGWLCAKAWRFSAPQPVAGMGLRAELLDAYEAEAGWRPTDAALRWWELFATVRWGLICAVQANRHLDGTERSVELAAIGRRSAEQEFDALLDLGIVEPERVADPLDAAAADPEHPFGEDLFGPPVAPELLESVADFLRSAPVTENMAPHIRFHTRVAANVLDVVRRQLLTAPESVPASAARLRDLGVANQRDLVAKLRDGTLDGDNPDVRAAIAADVRARLMVSNPKYFAVPHP